MRISQSTRPRRATSIGALLMSVFVVALSSFGSSAHATALRAGAVAMPHEVVPTRLLIQPVATELYGQPISEIRFEGNRRVESEAMLNELESSASELVTPTKLSADINNLWKLGYFEDVQVRGELTPTGVVLTYVVTERPTVHKIIVEGNASVKLSDINEVLDLERNEVLDLGKVKANVEKVKALYTQEGFFLADVSFLVQPVEDQPGKVDVVLVVREADEVIVRDITFVGNEAITKKELSTYLLTREGSYMGMLAKQAGGVYNQDAFLQDYTNIRGVYMDRGYLDTELDDAELSLSADRRFVHVTIPINEGPQYRVGELRAREVVPRGEEELFAQDYLDEIIRPQIRVGDIASVGDINLVREAIELKYKNNGYAYVNVIPNQRLDRENLKLYVVLEVQKGPLVYIERVDIAGQNRTADKVIRREIVLKEGDLYSDALKKASEYRVLRLGHFEDVVISTARGTSEDKIVLNIEVSERRTGTFQVGAGFSTIESFVLQAQISYENFLGRGSSVSLVAQMSRSRKLFNFRYYTPYFFDTNWKFVYSVYHTQDEFPGFSRQGTGTSFEWGYPLPKLLDLSFWAGYELEHVKGTRGSTGGGAFSFSNSNFFNVPQDALISNLFADGLTSAATARMQYDTRDNMLFPTSGQFHTLSGKFAHKYLGSKYRYNEYKLKSRFYVPVIKTDKSFRAWLVFRTQLQVSYIHSFEPLGVPVLNRYFAGGLYGHGGIRGFRMRSLSPIVKVQSSPNPAARLQGYSIGGNLLTALNMELEFMVIPPANIKGVVFFDSGNTFNTESQYCDKAESDLLPKTDPCVGFRVRDLRFSTGLGFRWQSPIGPLRFEWGFPLDRLKRTELRPYSDDPVVFEFNVGTGF